MKKLITPFFLSVLLLSACRKHVTQEITQVQQVNQAFSAVYTIQPGDWTTDNDGLTYTASLQIPELDKVIYQSGAVLVYLSFSGTSYYEALPEVFQGFTYGAIHSTGYVSIDIGAISGEEINPPAQTISAKVILIDAAKLALHKDVNLKDLRAVQRAFNVK